MDRRTFLASSAVVAAGLTSRSFADDFPAAIDSFAPQPPAFAVIPVVGDGKWIWTEPPKDQTGYLEPRLFELSIGVELQGTGNASGVMASTPVLIPCFSSSSASRLRAAFSAFTLAANAITSSFNGEASRRASMRGCSADNTIAVAPKIVSIRVVKTRILLSLSFSGKSM